MQFPSTLTLLLSLATLTLACNQPVTAKLARSLSPQSCPTTEICARDLEGRCTSNNGIYRRSPAPEPAAEAEITKLARAVEFSA